MKKRKKVILWFTGSMVFLLGIFSITVFVLLGNVKSFVNQNGQNYIGRKVHVDHINLNLLNAKVVINDLVVYEPNKLDSFLVMQSLGVNINLRSFFNKNYIIDQLKINGLSCKIVQNAGVFNFQDIVDTIKAKTQKDTSQTTEPIKWQISKIDLTNSAITYTDFKLPYPLKFDSLNINSNNGIGSQKSNVEFITDFKFNKSTGVNIAINYTAKNDSLITKLKVSRFGFNLVEPFIANSLNFKSILGVANTNLTLKSTIQHPANIDVLGKLKINDFAYINVKNEKLFGFNTLAFAIDSINPAKDLYEIRNIIMEAPYGDFHVYIDGHNFESLVKQNHKTLDTAGTQQAIEKLGEKPSNYLHELVDDIRNTIDHYRANNIHVDSINVAQGDFNFYDHVPAQTFKCHLENTTLTTHDFYFEKDSVMLQISALLNSSSALNSRLILYPHVKEDLSIDVSIAGFDMKTLSPYTYSYIGHRVDSGFLNLETSIIVKDNILKTDNYLMISALELGKKERHDDALKLPVKAGIKALTDKDNVLEVSVPVNGNLNDPDFKAGPLVKQALRNTLQKAATLPARKVKLLLKRKKQ